MAEQTAKDLIFDPEYNKQVHNEWVKALGGEAPDPKIVRPEIAALWQECIDRGIDPYASLTASDDLPRLRGKQLEALIDRSRLLCSIAEPFMDNLYRSIPGPDSFVALFDANCISLKGISSPGARESGLAEEMVPGILPDGMFGTILDTILCQRTGEPAWCIGEENFPVGSKNTICSSAPIKDEQGNLLAVLTISVDYKDAHGHTLGMTISAAKAIEEMLILREKNDRIQEIASRLTGAIESSPDGMLILDGRGNITNINSHAKKILFLKDPDVIGLPAGDVLRDSGDVFATDPTAPLMEQEMMLKTPSGKKRYFITVKKFSPNEGRSRDFALVIVKEQDYAKKLSNTVTNSFSRFNFDDIIGVSSLMQETKALAQIAAKSVSTVLITGPSGTGKELFAHAIHSGSDRANGPFISINCGALPAGLVESELFGYERGAFTGARKDGQIGKFELANHGTIFLDEIGEMPLAVQASVLRVIETKEVTRIGGSSPLLLDIRIIAATNRNLLREIEDKEFREDLYYRLNVLRVSIAPLLDRREDIRPLIDRFIEMYTQQLGKTNISVSDEAMQMLLRYDYPGNVRELENIIERAVNICPSDSELTPQILRLFLDTDTAGPARPAFAAAEPAFASPGGGNVRDMEKQLIIEALQSSGGSITKAAQITGIGRRSLYRKFEEYDIDYTSYRRR